MELTRVRSASESYRCIDERLPLSRNNEQLPSPQHHSHMEQDRLIPEVVVIKPSEEPMYAPDNINKQIEMESAADFSADADDVFMQVP